MGGCPALKCSLASIIRYKCRLLKKAGLLTHPIPANNSPARPESAKIDSSPWDPPCPKQGRSSSGNPRFTFHTSRFTAPLSDARTTSAACFNSLKLSHMRWDLQPRLVQIPLAGSHNYRTVRKPDSLLDRSNYESDETGHAVRSLSG